MNPEQEKLVRELVAAGDKATQGEWQPIQLSGELGPCAVKCGQSLLAREPNYAERDVAQNRADFVFLASAANARDTIKAMLAERDAMRAVVEAAEKVTGFTTFQLNEEYAGRFAFDVLYDAVDAYAALLGLNRGK